MSKMKNLVPFALGAFLLFTPNATAQTQVCETFDGGSANGWTAHPFAPAPVHMATGGNPNGWLNVISPGTNPDWFSPTTGLYSSNYRAGNVTKISVDLKEEGGPSIERVWLILLNAAGDSGAFVACNTPFRKSPVAGSGWQTYEFDVPAAMTTSPINAGPGSRRDWQYFGGGVGGSDDDKWNIYMTGGTASIQIAIAGNPLFGFDLPGTPWNYGLDNVCYSLDLVAPDHCNGDGGNQLGCTNCPCGNNATPGTIGGCLNSSGGSTRIFATGDTSVSLPAGTTTTTDLRFSLSGAQPGAFCVMLSGDAIAPTNAMNMCVGLNSGVQSLDRDSLRCAVMNIRRHGGRSANAMGEVGQVIAATGPQRPWGGEAQPHGGIYAQGGFVAGQTRYFQVTHRDDIAAVCMRGLNSSQAIEITFAP